MKSAYAILSALGLFLCGCAGTAERRNRVDDTHSEARFEPGSVVDVAILQPEVASSDQSVVETAMRRSARKYLINTKNYAVPADAYVDSAATLDEARAHPEKMVAVTKSDAVLFIAITQWETQDLLPKGRIYAGGKATLYGPEGALWERRFADWTILSPGGLTPSNRQEMYDSMVGTFTTELLSALPPKPIR